MTRWFTTVLIVVACSALVRADVTITTTATMEGGMGAMMGGQAPKTVLRIKGLVSRTDMDAMGHTMSAITDLNKKEMILLRHDEKIAQVITPAAPDKPGTPAAPMPKVDGTFAPTGRSQTIEGVKCDEYAFSATTAMGEMTSGQMPPQAAEMLRDMRVLLKGSIWTAKAAPGASDYLAFQKAAIEANLAAILAGGLPGGPSNGMDKILRQFSGAEGIPYLTEVTINIEGTGPGAEMMKQMGATKLTSRVTSISTDPVAAELLVVPSDYQLIKKPQ
jgi:hypothetical protein